MKAILTDYSHWSSARKLKYMDSVPDKYFTICSTEDAAGMNESNFAIYDVTELSSIDSGDGETIVQLKDKKNSIYCDRVAFFEDADDVVEQYIASLKEHGWKFKVKEIKEQKGYDGIELQVNAKNKAAYEMYSKYGFTEKSINMELL